MSNEGVSNANTGTSGEGVQNHGNGDEGKPKQDDKVSYESYHKVLGQLKNTAAQNKELSDRLNFLEQKEKQAQEESLLKQGEYKKIVELREKELSELRTKNEEILNENVIKEKKLQDNFKLHSFYAKLPGKIRNNDYLAFADLDSIAIDPSTNLPDEKSVQSAVDEFMKNHNHLVETSNTPPIPSRSGDINHGNFDLNNFSKMNVQDMKKNIGDLVRAEKQKLGIL